MFQHSKRKLAMVVDNCPIEAKKEFEFNILDALYLLRLSWESVAPSTVSGCFNHCGFVSISEDNSTDGVGNEDTRLSLSNTDIDDSRELFAKVNEDVNAEDYLEVDQQTVPYSMKSVF